MKDEHKEHMHHEMHDMAEMDHHVGHDMMNKICWKIGDRCSWKLLHC